MTDTLLSFGEIKYIKQLDFIYTSQISSKSKISLIFDLSNNKLIGKHESKLEHYNKGLLFKKIINKFIKKYNVDNNYKYNKLPNEINILNKINEKDINEKIYFLDNYSYKDNEGNEHFHDNLKEFNANTKLMINDEKEQFKKYFIPTKIGEYKINLKFEYNLTDCSYMFVGCNNIYDINFISFNTK